jgi:ribosome biogenesis GTPase / thiamine phosphate phosphatase
MSILATLGWGPFFSAQLSAQEASTLLPGRAIADRGPRLLVQFEDGQRLVVIPGRLRKAGEVPVVGDFLLALPGPDAPVVRVLSRRSALTRGAAGRATAQQVLAANVDLALVVQGLDRGVNPRRLERTQAAVRASGSEPVVVLTKSDLLDDPSGALAEAEDAAHGARVLLASGLTGEGLDELRSLLPSGRTGVLVGPSGAGKSTLLNALLGQDVQATGAVRASDRRGRHVTTGRSLLVLPSGGLLVDGPGIRELKLWDASGLDDAFGDLAAVAAGCRFRDCVHHGEPGCAVLAAIEAGQLDPARLEHFHKLERETAALAARKDSGAAGAEKQRWRPLAKEARRIKRERDRG